MVRAGLMEGCRERQEQRDGRGRQEAREACPTQHRANEGRALAAEHKLGETCRVLGNCLQGNRTLYVPCQ